MVEVICISWFTVEYLLRLAGAPRKSNFIKQTMNVIDILAIAPYYISLVFEDSSIDFSLISSGANDTMAASHNVNFTQDMKIDNDDTDTGSGFGNVSRILQVLRIARVMRIFKLARRSVGLQVEWLMRSLANKYAKLVKATIAVHQIFTYYGYFGITNLDGCTLLI